MTRFVRTHRGMFAVFMMLSVLLMASGCNLFRSDAPDYPDVVIPSTPDAAGENDAVDEESDDSEEDVDDTEDEDEGNDEDSDNDADTENDSKTGEVTWLGTPKELGDLKLFSYGPDAYTVTYTQIGTDGDSEIILAVVQVSAPGQPLLVRFRKVGTTYEYLPNISDTLYVSYGVPALAATVKTNAKLAYDSIAHHDTLSVEGMKLHAKDPLFVAGSRFFNELQTVDAYILKSYKDTEYGTLYTISIAPANIESATPTVATTKEAFVLKKEDGTAQVYQYDIPFMGDDFVPQITWTDATRNSSSYHMDGLTPGCGSGDAFHTVLTDTSMDELMQTGTASDGTAIYEPTAADTSLAKAGYATLYEGKYYDSETMEQKSITAAEYIKKHPLLVFKDKLGKLNLLISNTYGMGAECGKPVIYLYPEETTNVSVKVDAKITKSEPTYGDGWTTTAAPNGTLTMSDGTTYDSLFWEGIGHEYPQITSGTIVKQAELEATLWKHLAQLGLNEKESADFMEFWLEKMPTTPYVRLTWFGTAQMHALAPLSISPRPDSVLRIFLDFQGLEKPIKLPAQDLNTHFVRDGFTVIEWGGLLQK